ncbi:MAG: C-GCAxxG-C-C family protein [Methanomicrobiales archaeon]|nr:C-GCAxxG-C-C family protein [Methanomicrobiales archaeon]
MASQRAAEAVAAFNGGFSCSQAICTTYFQAFGIDRVTARKVSCGFGAGIARSGNICGAVSGAIMVIGLAYGMARSGDVASKEKTYRAVNDFLREFKRRNGDVDCTPLIGFDLSDPSQLEMAKERKVVTTRCPRFVKDAAEILDEILEL